MDVAALVDRLDAEIRSAGTPERATGSKAYLKSDLDFYGTTVPTLRATVKRVGREQPALTRGDLLALVTALWEPPVFERRQLAVFLLEAHVALLGAEDLPLLERWVREGAVWALVDNIAGDVAGPLLDRLERYDGAAVDAVLDRWASDGDVWVRRSALLAHLRALRAGGGDWGRFARYADAMLEDREFWIRKAIGWVLRDTARRRPDLVFDWLLPRATRASGVTLREALKHLSPEQQAAVNARLSRRTRARR
jgi:3-methyladenine DNA glycosylase AlkD